MAHPAILTSRDGPVLTITLNRPERRNAQLPSMWAELARLASELPGDVGVVVLNGAGKDFSAGLDRDIMTPGALAGEESVLAMAAAGDPSGVDRAIARYQDAFTAWSSCAAVVIAGVRGNAIGAGFQLALAADLRIAAEDARFAMREVALGLIPDLGGIGTLAREIGESRTLELCVTGRFITAAEALRLGLVNRVVPAGELTGAVAATSEAVLAMPVEAVRAIKPLVIGAAQRSREQQLALEREAQGQRLIAILTGGKRGGG